MPRLDDFLRAAGETVKVDDEKENSKSTADDPENAQNKDEDSQSNIDFDFYLREGKYTLDDVILPDQTKRQVD